MRYLKFRTDQSVTMSGPLLRIPGITGREIQLSQEINRKLLKELVLRRNEGFEWNGVSRVDELGAFSRIKERLILPLPADYVIHDQRSCVSVKWINAVDFK